MTPRSRRAYRDHQRAQGICQRCTGPVGEARRGRAYCAACARKRAVARARDRALFKRKPPVYSALGASQIERDYRAAMVAIQRRRLAGDPQWQVDAWAMRDRWDMALVETMELRGDGAR